MKTNITIIMLMVSSIVTAQNLFTNSSSISIKSQDEYLGGLFKECKLIYCESDSIGAMTFTKEMEVFFFDTTHFFAARIHSSPFTKNTYAFNIYECDSAYFDDGGDGLYFNAKTLKGHPYLKAILDAAIRDTPFVKYIGEWSDPED